MSPHTDPQTEVAQPAHGDIAEAVSSFFALIKETDEVIDRLRIRLVPCLLDLPESDMKKMTKEAQSYSPLTNELHELMSIVQVQRLHLERMCDMIQL